MWLFQLFKNIKTQFDSTREMIGLYQESPYYIEEINTRIQQVTIRPRGSRVVIKASFESVVGDPKILAGLSSVQACWIGGYYGRALRDAKHNGIALRTTQNMSFLLKNTRGRYKIVFQNRNADIGYIDQKTQKEFVESPLTIVQDKLIISRFDPCQACYLGLLAGISLEKALHAEKMGKSTVRALFSKKPQLRVIG